MYICITNNNVREGTVEINIMKPDRKKIENWAKTTALIFTMLHCLNNVRAQNENPISAIWYGCNNQLYKIKTELSNGMQNYLISLPKSEYIRNNFFFNLNLFSPDYNYHTNKSTLNSDNDISQRAKDINIATYSITKTIENINIESNSDTTRSDIKNSPHLKREFTLPKKQKIWNRSGTIILRK